MRVWSVLLFTACIGIASAQSVVGIWKPGLEHGKVSAAQGKKLAIAKLRIAGSSLKLNKDKSFGCILIDRIMRGKWSYDGKILTLRVTEVIGMTDKQFRALPEGDRVARLQFRGKKMVTLPVKVGATNMVWKKTG